MCAKVTRILVPTDFSPQADGAVEYACALAERFEASLHLLHVLEEPAAFSGLLGDIDTPEPPELRTRLVRDAEKRLATRLSRSDRLRLRATFDATFGMPAATICNCAANRGIDLIVMSTHGRTGLAHLMMGSVAERVLRTAPCPVLTIRPAVRARVRVPEEQPAESASA